MSHCSAKQTNQSRATIERQTGVRSVKSDRTGQRKALHAERSKCKSRTVYVVVVLALAHEHEPIGSDKDGSADEDEDQAKRSSS